MTREGFEHALSQACLSHYDPNIYPDPDSDSAGFSNAPLDGDCNEDKYSPDWRN